MDDLVETNRPEKIIDYSTMAESGVPDSTLYELDSNLSIRKVDDLIDVKVPSKLENVLEEDLDTSKLINLNQTLDPMDFVIATDPSISHDVDLQFNFNSDVHVDQVKPFEQTDFKSDAFNKVAIDDDLLKTDAIDSELLKNDAIDNDLLQKDTFDDHLKKDVINEEISKKDDSFLTKDNNESLFDDFSGQPEQNICDEKFDLLDLTASHISQGENSFSENNDLSLSSVNDNILGPSSDKTPVKDDVEFSSPVSSQSLTGDATIPENIINMDFSLQADVSQNDLFDLDNSAVKNVSMFDTPTSESSENPVKIDKTESDEIKSDVSNYSTLTMDISAESAKSSDSDRKCDLNETVTQNEFLDSSRLVDESVELVEEVSTSFNNFTPVTVEKTQMPEVESAESVILSTSSNEQDHKESDPPSDNSMNQPDEHFAESAPLETKVEAKHFFEPVMSESKEILSDAPQQVHAITPEPMTWQASPSSAEHVNVESDLLVGGGDGDESSGFVEVDDEMFSPVNDGNAVSAQVSAAPVFEPAELNKETSTDYFAMTDGAAAAATVQTAAPPLPVEDDAFTVNEYSNNQNGNTNLSHTSSTAVGEVLSALKEVEEEEVASEEFTQDKEDESSEEVEVHRHHKPLKVDDTSRQSSLSSSAEAVTKSVTCPQSSSFTAVTPPEPVIMGHRKNFKRDNSTDSEPDSGPDNVKECIVSLMGPNAAEILYWRDPKNTGPVFGVGLAILFSLTVFSVISVVAYTLFFTLLATLSFRIYKNVMQAVQKTNEGHPFKEYLDYDITPSEERIHEIVDQLLVYLNCTLKRLRSVILVEDLIDSIKFLLIFWSLTYIGALFNGMTLVILAYLGAFSLPKVYEMNKAQIDQHLSVVMGKVNEIKEKIPFLKKPVDEKKDE